MIEREQQLHSYCILNDIDGIKRLLSQKTDLDILYDEGVYIKLAIKHKNTELLSILLDHLKKTKLTGEIHSEEYQKTLEATREIIKESSEMFDISPTIQSIINDYLPHEEYKEAEVPDSRSKNYTLAYTNILARIQMILDKSENTAYATKIPSISLPYDISDISLTYTELKKFNNKITPIKEQLDKITAEEDTSKKLTEDQSKIKKLKWAIEGCQLYLNSFIKDIELQSPDLVDYGDHNTDENFHSELSGITSTDDV